ncbi:Hsp70 family protein [Nocardia sp. NPDC057227]|uniref:Hsp70 family protein n=1 Tax=Nocardia sp. NPDC057227 TaxID=3346056 RepID=UPI003634935C
MTARVIGIDLGTTFSAVSAIGSSGLPQIIPNRDGGNITPSVVLFDGPEVVVGTHAKRQSSAFPLDTVQFIKRHMGNPDYRFYPESGDAEYRPEQISALILKSLVFNARRELDEHVVDAVITVPAYFGDAQRTATRQAGEIAGLNVIGIVNEPTAAAVSFGLNRDFSGTLLVFDLGGGTLDVTVMRCSGGTFDVLAVEGDPQLGGYDFDNAIITWAMESFLHAGGKRFEEDSAAGAQLRERAEDAKRRLSTSDSTTLFLTHLDHSAKLRLTRAEFEQLSRHLLVQCEYKLEEAVELAGLTFREIDKVLLVGGSTRMPMVRDLVERVTGRSPDVSVHPDEAVALGAAIIGELRHSEATGRAPVLAGRNDITIVDVVSHGLGVVADDERGIPANSIIVRQSSRVPCQVTTDRFATVADGQTSLLLQVTEGDENGVDPKYVKILGTTELKLSGRPAGSPVRLVFSCDIDGTLHVEVIDLVDGRHLGEMMIDRIANYTQAEVANSESEMRYVKVREG